MAENNSFVFNTRNYIAGCIAGNLKYISIYQTKFNVNF